MDILGASLDGTRQLYYPALLASSAAAPSARIASGTAAAGVPLDPSTGLPLASRGQVEVMAARALFQWNVQVLAALQGREAGALAFSTASYASIQAVQAMIAGGSLPLAISAAGPSAAYSASGDSSTLLDAILDFFSPAASGLRVAGYGSALAGGSGGTDALGPALAAATGAAGSGAPGLVLLAFHRAEAFSLRALDLYAVGGAPSFPADVSPYGGYTGFAMSALDLEYASETDFLLAYFGSDPGAGGYSPIDLFA